MRMSACTCRTSAAPSGPSSCSRRWRGVRAAASAAGTCWCRRSRRTTRASRWRRTTTTASSRSWSWSHRKLHKYPPYERMARLIVRSEKEDAACAFADVLATAFKEAMKRAQAPAGVSLPRRIAPVRLLGPAECPVFRLNNYYRFHFQLQSDSSAVLHEVLRNVLALAKPPSAASSSRWTSTRTACCDARREWLQSVQFCGAEPMSFTERVRCRSKRTGCGPGSCAPG